MHSKLSFADPVGSKKPVILVVVPLMVEEAIKNGKPDPLESYVRALENEGAEVTRLSQSNTREEINHAIFESDGVLIPGGQDIDTRIYGERATGIDPTQLSNIEFDKFQLNIVDEAFRSRRPLLGICRGSQLINVYLGGTLIQDLPTQYPQLRYEHLKREAGRAVLTEHPIIVDQKSKFFEMLGGMRTLDINSYHHQAWKKMGRGLKVVAWSPDKVPEAFEYVGNQTIWGVQFHPEKMLQKNPDSPFRNYFRRFVERANHFQENMPLKYRRVSVCLSHSRWLAR